MGREWRTIREELDRALLRKHELPKVQDLAIDAIAIIRDAGWKIFVPVAYAIRSAQYRGLSPDLADCAKDSRATKTCDGGCGDSTPPHKQRHGLLSEAQIQTYAYHVGAGAVGADQRAGGRATRIVYAARAYAELVQKSGLQARIGHDLIGEADAQQN